MVRGLLMVVVGVVLASSRGVRADDPCAQARELIRSGRAEAALPVLMQLSGPGTSPCAIALRFEVFRQTLRFEEGLALADQWVATSDETGLDSEVLEPLVEFLAEAGSIRRGLDLLVRARSTRTNRSSWLLLEARLRFSLGEVERAIECCRTILGELDVATGRPEFSCEFEASVRYLLGASLARSGDTSLARGELERSLALDASRDLARLELARLFLRDREYARAILELRRILRRDPRDVAALQAHSQALLRSGAECEARRALVRFGEENRAAELRKDYQRTAQANPGNLRAMADLALFHERRSEYRDALPLIDRCLALLAVDADERQSSLAASLRLARGRSLRGLGQPQEALGECLRAVELDPDRDAARIEAAEIAATLGQVRLARQIVERLRSPLGDERVELLKAEIAAREGRDWQQLGPLVQRAVDAGTSLEALLAWVDATAAFGAVAQGRRELDRWVTERPGDPRPLIARATLLIERGDLEAASADVEKALKLDPLLDAAHSTHAIVLRRRGELEAAEAAAERGRDLVYLGVD